MTSSRVTLALAVALALPACGEEADGAQDEAAVDAIPADDPTSFVLADDPGDASSYTLRPKMTVSSIVLERYGSRHYTRPVLLHNQIKDASRLPIGQVIKTPDFEQMLKEEPGLYRRAKDEVEALLEIRRAFMSIETQLDAVASAAKDPMQFTVEPELGASLSELAKRLEQVGDDLAKERPDTKKAPTKMIGSVFEAAAIFRQIAAGEMMDERFDADQIHQRLGNAIADAIIWARVERR